MIVREADVPVDPVVAGAAEILGIDPMYVANEGKLVAFVAPERADAALAALRAVPGLRARGRDRRGATEPPGMVLVETASADGGSWTSWWGTRCRGSVERRGAMPVEFAPKAARDGGRSPPT